MQTQSLPTSTSRARAVKRSHGSIAERTAPIGFLIAFGFTAALVLGYL